MRPLWLTALLGLAACGYSSQYVAPADGRPRAVWHEDHVVVDSANAPLDIGCLQQIGWISDTNKLHLVTGELRMDAPPPPSGGGAGGVFAVAVVAGFWAPRYYGPPIVVVRPGVAPILPVPPLFLPAPVLHVPVPHPVGVGVAGPGGSGAHVGGGGGDGKAWAILAALALVVMPAVAVGLAAARPEDSDKNAEAIDQVNVYNDLLRSPGSPCTTWGGAS
jgi:hypothetical protein